MKQQLIIYLFFICKISVTTLCMEKIPQTLAPHDPEIAKVHEQSLRGWKGSNTNHIQIQRDAIAYFESTDHPKREFMLRQCEAAKKIIGIYVPKIQSKFTALLTQEQAQPDSTRWEKIKKVLPLDTTIDLHPDKQLIQKLIVLAHDPEQSHEKWLEIITPLKVTSPLLPPLPQLPLHSSFLEDQTSDQDDDVEEDEDEESDNDEDDQEKSVDAPQPKQPAAVQKKASTSKKNRVFVGKKKKNKQKGKQGKGKKKKPVQSRQAQQKKNLIKRFWDLLRAKNAVALYQLLTEHKSILDANMRHAKLEKPALHLAVMLEDPALCTVLLENGANPRETSLLSVPFMTHPLRVSALALAVHTRSPELVELLLNHDADPNQPITCQNVETEHILCLAATGSHLDPKYSPELQERMIRSLLLRGAKAPCKSIVLIDLERNKTWPIVLEHAVHQSCIELLLKCTKEIKCVDNSILLYADSQNITEILEAPEDLETSEDDTEEMPLNHQLWSALSKRNTPKVRTLLEMVKDPALLTTVSEYCSIPMLHFCVNENLKDLCVLLLDHKADPNSTVTIDVEEGQSQETLEVTPLTYAILNGNVDMATLLVQRGADLNKKHIHLPSGSHEYPLCCAIAGLGSANPNVSLNTRKQMVKFFFMSGATQCTVKILMRNTKTNSESLLDPNDPVDHGIIRMILEENNFEECMEYAEDALVLKTSIDLPEENVIGDEINQCILGSSNDQELSE